MVRSSCGFDGWLAKVRNIRGKQGQDQIYFT
jgi:hypothetical protein